MDYFKIDLSCSRKTLKQINKCIAQLKFIDFDKNGLKLVDNLEEIRNINSILIYWLNVKRHTTNKKMVYDHVHLMLALMGDNYVGYQYSFDDIDNVANSLYKNIDYSNVKDEMVNIAR